jgi:AraC-like DNA-binding protein
MEYKFPPQFKLEDLYISPFKYQRFFDPESGLTHYEPLERNLTPTGVNLLDTYLQIMCTSSAYSQLMVQARFGVTSEQLCTLCLLLTGMTHDKLQLAISLRVADDLLRYTSLSMRDIGRRCGFASGVGLTRVIQRHYNCTPLERRKALRKKNDEGKFAISLS